jgi:predicted Zn-ribbon and HTH transcriptional regulator
LGDFNCRRCGFDFDSTLADIASQSRTLIHTF